MSPASSAADAWPALRVDEWTPTRDTLHMITQVVGKVRLAHAPLVNHWWQSALYVSARGLTTSAVPVGSGVVDLELDLVDHELVVWSSSGERRRVGLQARPVADFYAELVVVLDALGIDRPHQPRPNEVDPSIPFAEDDVHSAYEPEAAHLFWRQLVAADRVLGRFRARYSGKVSPVHFFWGSMDLACTRFSGRPAPQHPGGAPNCGDWVMVEGYSHELSSCGFWPGGGEEGAFYAYAYPEPDGFHDTAGLPDGSVYSIEGGQFRLPYEAVRTAADPDATLMAFLQRTYEAAADPAGWDRAALEVDPDRWQHHRRQRGSGRGAGR
ncbi:DUF5996 family protein [Quadrisphaera setariae]|uniref:Ava_C0101 and related proteins n=1 Tax=Quadrisphaera setariae TaxID=2593304 RepID=A0A5C8ZBN4_9ACTN|nr:DUF5996 family protein [Quadrisphaera setariae]TXR55515.1 hypothetical protein FMM08_14515 [Quadrisphaera setariae]